MNYSRSYGVVGPSSKGKTIYILGPAMNGPINEPIHIVGIDEAINKFGSVYESPLTRAYLQYSLSGGVAAYLVRVTGSRAKITIKAMIDETEIEILELMAINGGTSGNNIGVLFTDNAITLIHPGAAIGDESTFDFAEYETPEMLAKAINFFTADVLEATALEPEYDNTLLASDNPGLIQLIGGEDGIDVTKNEYYLALETTLELLKGTHIDIFCMVNAFLDDVVPTYYTDSPLYGQMYYVADRDYLDMIDGTGKQVGFHKLAIDFCRTQIALGIFTHCIMGMNLVPNPLPEGYAPPVMILNATALGYGDGIRESYGGMWIDYGRYLSICYGDMTYETGELDTFNDNFYLTYAALWIKSNYNDSLTAAPLIGGTTVQTFDDVTIQDITALGAVTYKFSPLNGWCIAAGITTALPDNPMFVASNSKIVQRVLSKLNEALEAYMENPGGPITNSGVGAIVEGSLKDRRDIEKIIRDYQYSISYDRLTGTTTVELDIYTVYTIEKITASTSIYTNRGGRYYGP